MRKLRRLNGVANLEYLRKGFVTAILYCCSICLGQTGSTTGQPEQSQQPPAQSSTPPWQYGGFVDFGYSLDFNHPANRVFRSRGTVWHVDEVDWNMAGAYVQKNASQPSRLGAVLTIQAGGGFVDFWFFSTTPHPPPAKRRRALRHTKLSYFLPPRH